MALGLGRTVPPGPPLVRAVATATPKHTESGSPVRWRREQVLFRIDASLIEAFPASKDAVSAAFGAWSGVVPGVPELAITDDPSAPNVVSLAPAGMVLPTNALAVTRLTFSSDTGEIVRAEILVDASAHSFSVRDAGDTRDEHEDATDATFDLQSVIAHETGHALGLGEDYEDGRATMFVRATPGDVSKRELSAADRAAVASAYEGDTGAAASKKACAVAAPGAPGESGLTCIGVAVLLAWGVRRRLRRPRAHSA